MPLNPLPALDDWLTEQPIIGSISLRADASRIPEGEVRQCRGNIKPVATRRIGEMERNKYHLWIFCRVKSEKNVQTPRSAASGETDAGHAGQVQ